MALREKGQSQLDYLWVNFGNLQTSKETREQGGFLITSDDISNQVEDAKLLAVSQLEIVGNKLLGKNYKGNKLTEITLSDLSNGGQINGSETDSIVLEVIDNTISGRLKINNEDSLIALIETDNGLKAEFTDKELIQKIELVQNVAADLESLKTDVKTNSDALLILNGDENQEGSVLNIVSNQIINAFNWQEIQ